MVLISDTFFLENPFHHDITLCFKMNKILQIKLLLFALAAISSILVSLTTQRKIFKQLEFDVQDQP